MNNIVKYGLIAAVIAGVYFFNGSDETSYVEDKIDLSLVLDVTVDTLHAYQETLDSQQGLVNQEGEASPATAATNPDPDEAFVGFANALAANYNKSQPAIYTGPIGVSPQTNASLLAFSDANSNQTYDDKEEALFLIEIDGEKARIIASSNSGAVKDHHFSGTSLLAGYLIGSMLSRQRAAGVDPKSLSSKQPITASAAAKARAGSGSHSRGK